MRLTRRPRSRKRPTNTGTGDNTNSGTDDNTNSGTDDNTNTDNGNDDSEDDDSTDGNSNDDNSNDGTEKAEELFHDYHLFWFSLITTLARAISSRPDSRSRAVTPSTSPSESRNTAVTGV